MAESSILGGDHPTTIPPGHDIDSLGPSDSSDSGSDVQGQRVHSGADAASEGAMPAARRSDTDAAGTGERGSATGSADDDSPDIRPDRIRSMSDEDLSDVDADDRIDIDVDEIAVSESDDPDEDQV